MIALKAKYIFEGLHENQRIEFSLRSPCERVVGLSPRAAAPRGRCRAHTAIAGCEQRDWVVTIPLSARERESICRWSGQKTQGFRGGVFLFIYLHSPEGLNSGLCGVWLNVGMLAVSRVLNLLEREDAVPFSLLLCKGWVLQWWRKWGERQIRIATRTKRAATCGLLSAPGRPVLPHCFRLCAVFFFFSMPCLRPSWLHGCLVRRSRFHSRLS
jgi:hypothetical protein